MLKPLVAAVCSCSLLLCSLALAQSGKGVPPSDEWKALLQEATDLFFEGKFDGGVVVAKKALELAESERGLNHPSVTASLNRLAELQRALSQYAAAEPLSKRALALAESAHGGEHPGTIRAWRRRCKDLRRSTRRRTGTSLPRH